MHKTHWRQLRETPLQVFKKLQALKAFEREHFQVLSTLEDYNLVREIGFHQAEGTPLTLKQIFLLDIGSVATIQRRLRRLKQAGVIAQRRSNADGRALELSLAPKYAKAFEKYGQLLAERAGSQHLCCLCDDEDTCRGRLARYLGEGLRNGQRCILLAPRDSAEEVLNILLASRKRDMPFVFEGLDPPHEHIAFLNGLFKEAKAAGQGVRLAADMRWALEKGFKPEELKDLEHKVDRLAARYSANVLCVYDVRHFDSPALLQALAAHPEASGSGLQVVA